MENDALELVAKWRSDPEIFCSQILGMTLWEKQRDILQSVVTTPETFVPSCNGAGKTEIAAAAVLWWLLTRQSRVVTTAPTWRQVKNVLWGRIHSHIHEKKELIGGEILATQLKIAPDWEAIGVATTEPGKFQGFHSPGGVLVVVDEAGGVANPELWGAIDGCLVDSKSRLLAIGNPTTTTGEFYARCSLPIEGQRNVLTISAFDTPNVKANKVIVDGLVELPFIERKRVEWGEESPLWQSRILGQFPRSGSDALYPLGWLENAFNGLNQAARGEKVVAMDVARKGDDSNAICVRDGGILLDITAWVEPDTTKSADRLLSVLRQERPVSVRIDTIGVGGPVADLTRLRLRTEGFLRNTRVEDFQASERAYDDERFRNRKAEAYWHFRDMLREGQVDMSRMPAEFRAKIERQATAVRYEYDAQGKLKIEDKQAMRRRVGYSPDELEAVIMAYYESPGLPVDGEAIVGYADTLEDDMTPYLGQNAWDYSRFDLPDYAA